MTEQNAPHPDDSFPRLQARTQRFTLGTPSGFTVLPDGSRVLFTRSAGPTERPQSLWSLDLTTGAESRLVDPADLLDTEENLSPEEKALRERTRTQAAGITGISTDTAGRIAVFALSGRLFVTDLTTPDAPTRELPATAPVIDPRPDPTGTRIAYVAGGALRVLDVDGAGPEVVLADPGAEREHVTWGLADFIAAEEMDRYRGYWWSPDGTRLLATRTDNSGVARWHIADPANPSSPASTFPYPAAGTDNETVDVAVLGLDGTHTPVGWDQHALPYVTAVHWSAGGPPLLAAQSRDQRRIVVFEIDPDTGATTERQRLTDPHWVDIVSGAPAWTPDGRLLTVAARDGAYRLLADGEPITEPGLQVRSIVDVADDVLITASESDPTQVHVYRIGDGGTKRVSEVDGVHGAVRSGGTTVLLSRGLDFTGLRAVALADGAALPIRSLAATPPVSPRPVLHTVGARNLRCALLLPTGYSPADGRLPVLLDPYGGPHAQRVLHSQAAFVTSQWFADQGFAVLVVDGRGMAGRGPDWDREIALDFADATLTDQVDALHAVAADHPELDLDRVAIRGWSFGGYLSALAVLRRPDVFRAAIAGAPVTDWRLYDTHYTERYLGHPATNPEVYDRNSLLADAPNLRRPLLLIHGLADDNVFAAHSLRLSAALLATGRPHTVLPLSNATHMGPTGEQEAEGFLNYQLTWLRDALT